MTLVWNKIEELSESIETLFEKSGAQTNCEELSYDWYNKIYTSEKYRRAHIEIVDKRETYNIFILHCTVFPHYDDPSPIWGFDAVCGPSKITGAFLDFSAGGSSSHVMMRWFAEQSRELCWNKPRQLPDWAKEIFSPAMIAAGNVKDEAELDSLCDIALESLKYYLFMVGKKDSGNYQESHNRYCQFQKQNPHVVNSMVAMGVPKEKIIKFINEILFPEV